MKKTFVSLVLALAMLSACATPFVATPIGQITLTDLTDARDNFTMAGYTVEAKCMQNAIDKLQAVGGEAFKVQGVASFGSVAYIEVDRINQRLAAGPNSLSTECQAVVGRVVMFAAQKTLSLGAKTLLP